MNKGIFKEFEFKNLKLRNRAIMAPMCMYCAENDGMATDFHYVHYLSRAIGGIGAVIIEATGITPNGRITDKDLGIWSDTHVDGLKNIVTGIKKYGAAAGIQIGHAGRKCEIKSEEIIAPSAIAFSEDYKLPKEMTIEDMENTKIAFKDAAKRALDAGFDFIEIHGAHGYLISEFLSPLSNKRTDKYGGNVENRSRFLIEIIREIKKVWPDDKVLALRVSARDYVVGGNTRVEMSQIIDLVKQEGIDLVNVSTGAIVPARINTFTGYQIPDAEYIKYHSNIPTIGGGLITTANEANEIIENNRCDLVFFGRVLLREPYFITNEALKQGMELPYVVPSYKRGN